VELFMLVFLSIDIAGVVVVAGLEAGAGAVVAGNSSSHSSSS
jgi:hypothetical protein